MKKHLCKARDERTFRFCKATRLEDKAAMNELMADLLPLVRDSVTWRLGKRELSLWFADIVACESLLKALRNADKFDCSRCSIMGWVYGIVSNEVVNCIRAEKAFDLLSLDRDGNGHDESGNGLYRSVRDRHALKPIDELILLEDEMRHQKKIAALDATIRQLPPIERQVVEAQCTGVPNRIIARELNIKPERVAMIYFNAKAYLRNRVG